MKKKQVTVLSKISGLTSWGHLSLGENTVDEDKAAKLVEHGLCTYAPADNTPTSASSEEALEDDTVKPRKDSRSRWTADYNR